MGGFSKTYDPKRNVLAFLGLNITGYAEGTFIKVARGADTFTKHVGSDGEVARTRSRDKSGSITITLMGSSLSNDDLSVAAALDELRGDGVGPILLKDLQGSSIAGGPNAWVRKVPDLERAKELGH